MKSRYYTVTLRTKAPIYIGSGTKMNKKEYIFDFRKKKISVPDIQKMYMEIKKDGYEKDFQKFMLYDNRESLFQWLNSFGYREEAFKRWQKYEMDCGDAILENVKTFEVNCLVKDPYGLPYIPGSSLKGLFRTALLTQHLKNNPKLFDRYAAIVKDESLNKNRKNKKVYLSREMRDIETEAFNSLGRSETKNDVVNDVLSRLVISDSKPLSTDDIVLCQKIEMHRDGSKHALPILRECIKPGVEIEFAMEIGEELNVNKEDIMKAIETVGEIYYSHVVSIYPKVAKSKPDTLWFGGGVGFHSKTIINALLDNYTDSLRVTDNILKATLGNNYFVHKHQYDVGNGLSPHILKLTKYQGKYYQMGSVSVRIEEK